MAHACIRGVSNRDKDWCAHDLTPICYWYEVFVYVSCSSFIYYPIIILALANNTFVYYESVVLAFLFLAL